MSKELYMVWSSLDDLICIDEKPEAEKEYKKQLEFFKRMDSDEIDTKEDVLIIAKVEKQATWKNVEDIDNQTYVDFKE